MMYALSGNEDSNTFSRGWQAFLTVMTNLPFYSPISALSGLKIFPAVQNTGKSEKRRCIDMPTGKGKNQTDTSSSNANQQTQQNRNLNANQGQNVSQPQKKSGK
jgi:hypothetical protein